MYNVQIANGYQSETGECKYLSVGKTPCFIDAVRMYVVQLEAKRSGRISKDGIVIDVEYVLKGIVLDRQTVK